MKSYYSIESARQALEKMSDVDEKLTLQEAIKTAENLIKWKSKYFLDEETENPIELYNLIEKVDCLQEDENFSLLGLELMVACEGPNTWILIDDRDNIIVRCYWGDQMEIQLGDIGITLDEIKDIFSHLIER